MQKIIHIPTGYSVKFTLLYHITEIPISFSPNYSNLLYHQLSQSNNFFDTLSGGMEAEELFKYNIQYYTFFLSPTEGILYCWFRYIKPKDYTKNFEITSMLLDTQFNKRDLRNVISEEFEFITIE